MFFSNRKIEILISKRIELDVQIDKLVEKITEMEGLKKSKYKKIQELRKDCIACYRLKRMRLEEERTELIKK